ncbi:hypothetical protein BT63DRAFT_416636 [Microthyrium microscopicum]|uniref:Uncharacterized protein n=1 Tax=Microthyrium microscopicum TaxID=703497 RepID=A0A6A6U1R4_9PEZI|nr:hypothetical protein BT63DRAFT_416636 [Microthyrium microscopicum]
MMLFYSLCFLTLIAMTAAYFTRSRWLHLLPTPSYLYTQLPTTFRGDVEAGLHSADFDMTGNVEGDSRSGLDENGKRQVLTIMKRRGVGFDEARRIYMEQNFKKAGIGSDGLPKDPKFVSFS